MEKIGANPGQSTRQICFSNLKDVGIKTETKVWALHILTLVMYSHLCWVLIYYEGLAPLHMHRFA